MVFCDNTLKCKSSAGKPFIYYHLISDTVYSMSLPGQRLKHHDQPPYSDSNDETYPQESSKDLDRGSVPRNDSTNVHIPPQNSKMSNGQSQTDVAQEINTSTQTDIADSSSRVQSIQTDNTERPRVGVQVSPHQL
jgi:hypothetical protein